MIDVPAPPPDPATEWSVAIFVHRESFWCLTKTILLALSALRENAVVDVLVNGNRPLSQVTSTFVQSLDMGFLPISVLLRVWDIKQGDKALAWNQYIHGICPESASLSFFLDGYAHLFPDAMEKLAQAAQDNTHATAFTGIPYAPGRQHFQKQMVAEHGLHGNFYAIKGDTVRSMRHSGFMLPAGLYRTDSLVGAAIKFQLDPAQNPWDNQRVCVVPGAQWHYRIPSKTSPSDWVAHLRRILRQGQGALENAAIKQRLSTERKKPQELPTTAFDLICDWARQRPAHAAGFLAKNPAALAALWLLKPAHNTVSPETLPALQGQNHTILSIRTHAHLI